MQLVLINQKKLSLFKISTNSDIVLKNQTCAFYDQFCLEAPQKALVSNRPLIDTRANKTQKTPRLQAKFNPKHNRDLEASIYIIQNTVT
jgi:hypothetical protein